MQGFLSDCQKHERARSHLQAYKMWKTFDVSERVDVLFSRARREEIERHNEEVRQNREMLRTLSEAVLYLAKQELPFRGHDENQLHNVITEKFIDKPRRLNFMYKQI